MLDIFRGSRLPVDEVAPNGVPVEWRGQWFDQVMGFSVEKLWETQPALRTVVTFRARNVAQLGLHAFERLADGGRDRLRDDPLAQLIKQPNADQTAYELLYELVAALDLYDEAYWVVGESDTPSGFEIRSIPSGWVTGVRGGTFWRPDAYIVSPPGKPMFEVKAEQTIVFHGWSPLSGTRGTSPVKALRQTLAEQINAQEYRLQVWQRGGRAGTVVTRPQGATWTQEAQNRFMAALKERFTGSGSEAGGPLLLQDGMTIEQPGFSAKDNQFIDAAKLSIATVASVYHVNPTMIGQLDNANFSNVREFRRMLYTETLGPLLAQIQDRVNAFLVPRITDRATAYLEFNIGEKLRGSFEEQAAVTSTATGAPWMTRNEARALNNLPSVDGADELIVPLNVIEGGQASPQDGGAASGTQSGPRRPAKRSPLLLKERATPKQVNTVRDVFAAFFDRQARAVLSALGAKADSWWDEERWVKELSADLLAAGTPLTVDAARKTLEDAGIDPDTYDVDRTVNYLKAVATNTATRVNKATKEQLDAALDDDDPDAADHVFDVAADSRADQSGLTYATALAGFATVEAVHQSGGSGATKTWIVTSGKPRAAHAAMNGETVPYDDSFSNGAAWPGDASALDVDDIAGCTCDVQIDFP
nr:phage portal protein [Curtobacterium sp. WW7]